MLSLVLGAVLSIAPADEKELENGARVIVMEVQGAPRIALEAFYDVGVVDGPAGLTQAAHLVEHAVCMGATGQDPENAPGAAWQRLSARGMINAETLGDFTHYDYEIGRA